MYNEAKLIVARCTHLLVVYLKTIRRSLTI
jgi:hypothetical protein